MTNEPKLTPPSQHFAKLLKSKTTSSDTTDSATTEAPKTTRGVAKKVPNPKKRKAEAVTTEDGADGSADQEDVEDEDVKNTLDAGKAVAKAKAAVKGGAAKEKAAGKIKAEPKPKATRAKKVKTEDGGLKTENHDGDEAVGGAASGEGGKSE